MKYKWIDWIRLHDKIWKNKSIPLDKRVRMCRKIIKLSERP